MLKKKRFVWFKYFFFFISFFVSSKSSCKIVHKHWLIEFSWHSWSLKYINTWQRKYDVDVSAYFSIKIHSIHSPVSSLFEHEILTWYQARIFRISKSLFWRFSYFWLFNIGKSPKLLISVLRMYGTMWSGKIHLYSIMKWNV